MLYSGHGSKQTADTQKGLKTMEINHIDQAMSIMCNRVKSLIKPAHRWALNFDPVVDNRFSLHLSRPLNEGEIEAVTSGFNKQGDWLYTFKARCIKTVLTVDYEVKNLG
jgi:hypothetical protein